jgi:deazaflavin-dependent oxidoreductase (nitroreductase family)
VFPFLEDLLTEDDGMSDWNRGVIDEFRANEGRVASFARQPLLLLTHTGARTGTRRTNPLAYFRDGERYIVVASKGGAPSNPDWYYNLLANPRATIEVGTEHLEVIADPADPAERARLWAMITERNPAFKGYEKRTRRTIPVVILTPVSLTTTESGASRRANGQPRRSGRP